MRRKKRVLWVCVILAILILGPLGIVLFLFQDEPPSPDDDLRPVRRDVPDASNGFFVLNLTEDEVLWPDDDENIASSSDSFDAANAREIVANHAAAIEKLERSLAAPDFQVPVFSPFYVPRPYLVPWRHLTDILACRQRLLLEEGKLDEAMRASLSLILFGHRIEQSQGSLLEFLVGSAIKSRGIECAVRWVEHPSKGSLHLARLMDELKRFSAADEALRDALRQEYVGLASTVDAFSQGKLAGKTAVRTRGDFFYKVPFFLRPNATKRMAAEYFRLLVSSIAKPSVEKLPSDFTRQFGAEGIGMWLRPNSIGRSLLLLLLPTFQAVPGQLRLENFQMSALRVLIALKRFRIARERLPASLADLVPDYLPDVPVDPFDGKPLRYSAEKRLIYSVGEDLKDSGGSEAEEFWETLSDKKEPTLRIRA